MNSRGGLAAIHGDDLAADERCPFGGSEQDSVGDLFAPACTFEWHAGDQVGFPVGTAGKAIEHRGLDRAGATALTRTPNAAPSSAADLVRPSTACLLAV